jgi:hypothetical protein
LANDLRSPAPPTAVLDKQQHDHADHENRQDSRHSGVLASSRKSDPSHEGRTDKGSYLCGERKQSKKNSARISGGGEAD